MVMGTAYHNVPNGGSARGYQAIFVASATLGSPGYDGQPAVYLYIAALEVNVLNSANGSTSRTWVETWPRPGFERALLMPQAELAESCRY